MENRKRKSGEFEHDAKSEEEPKKCYTINNVPAEPLIMICDYFSSGKDIANLELVAPFNAYVWSGIKELSLEHTPHFVNGEMSQPRVVCLEKEFQTRETLEAMIKNVMEKAVNLRKVSINCSDAFNNSIEDGRHFLQHLNRQLVKSPKKIREVFLGAHLSMMPDAEDLISRVSPTLKILTLHLVTDEALEDDHGHEFNHRFAIRAMRHANQLEKLSVFADCQGAEATFDYDLLAEVMTSMQNMNQLKLYITSLFSVESILRFLRCASVVLGKKHENIGKLELCSATIEGFVTAMRQAVIDEVDVAFEHVSDLVLKIDVLYGLCNASDSWEQFLWKQFPRLKRADVVARPVFDFDMAKMIVTFLEAYKIGFRFGDWNKMLSVTVKPYGSVVSLNDTTAQNQVKQRIHEFVEYIEQKTGIQCTVTGSNSINMDDFRVRCSLGKALCDVTVQLGKL